ncbi:MAG: hypothetical protein ACK4UO_12975 [Pseudolabrys sp.]
MSNSRAAIQHGLQPLTPDKRDKRYFFHRNFGAAKLSGLPDYFSCDAGLTMPNQHEDNAPTECTAYTVADLGTDQDGVLYSPDYTFAQTLRLQGAKPNQQGADLRMGLKSAIAFGLLRKESAPFTAKEKGQEFIANWLVWPRALELEAIKNAKAAYYGCTTGPYDAFGNICSALWINRDKKMGAAIGTPWLPEWSRVGPDGIIPPGAEISKHRAESLPWHAWKIAGWATFNGEPYLIGKTWQGPNVGDHGFLYFDRDTINRVLAVEGTGAFTISEYGNRLVFLLGTMLESFPWLLRLLPSLVAILTTQQDNSVTVPPAPEPQPEPAQETQSERILATAELHIGKDASPNDLAPDELGCAETLSNILHEALPDFPANILSTAILYQTLRVHPNFKRVDNPEAGDIVISPTGYQPTSSTVTNGHCGVVARENRILSNDSKTGKFLDNYSIEAWAKYYGLKGGYPVYFFRRSA